MSGGFSLIEDQVLGSAAASITFNTGLTDYTKFRLTVYVIKDGTGGQIFVRCNGDTGSNYAQQRLSADATTAAGQRLTGQTSVAIAAYATVTANGTGLFTISISKPLAGTPARGESSGSYFADLATDAVLLDEVAFEWNNTAALISSLSILSSSGNFAAGTRAVLEGAA